MSKGSRRKQEKHTHKNKYDRFSKAERNREAYEKKQHEDLVTADRKKQRQPPYEPSSLISSITSPPSPTKPKVRYDPVKGRYVNVEE